MLSRCLIIVLGSSLAWAQAGSAPQSGTPPRPEQAQPAQGAAGSAPATPPSPTSPVITIMGLCAEPASEQTKTDPNCKTVVTREQFDKMASALSPQKPLGASARFQLANQWAQSLALATVASQRGLDKKEDVQQVLYFQQMRALAEILLRDMQEHLPKVSADEVAKYYSQHKTDFEDLTLKRLLVPKNGPDGKPRNDAVVKAEAQKIRARAAAGEDFDKLQKEIFQTGGFKQELPVTNLGAVRRDSLPPQASEVFNLKAGEISQPIADASAYFVFQLVSRKAVPLESAKADVERSLMESRVQGAIDSIVSNYRPIFDQAYLGGAPAAGPDGAKTPARPTVPRPAAAPTKPQP